MLLRADKRLPVNPSQRETHQSNISVVIEKCMALSFELVSVATGPRHQLLYGKCSKRLCTNDMGWPIDSALKVIKDFLSKLSSDILSVCHVFVSWYQCATESVSVMTKV